MSAPEAAHNLQPPNCCRCRCRCQAIPRLRGDGVLCGAIFKVDSEAALVRGAAEGRG